jgi:hypothetical protein
MTILKDVPLSPYKAEIVRRYAEEISAYPTSVIEKLLRKQIKRDVARLRREHPDLFEERHR